MSLGTEDYKRNRFEKNNAGAHDDVGIIILYIIYVAICLRNKANSLRGYV